MGQGDLIIRASMLPAYPDCGRRAAAKQYGFLVRKAGFELRQLLPTVGAAVGTAMHKVLEQVLRPKMEGGPAGTVESGMQPALALFREEISPGAEWDDTTPNLQVAEFQLRRMAEAALPIALTRNPLALEVELRAEVGPGWELVGHVDLFTREGHLDDWKSGYVRRPYNAQLGGYSLLLRSNNYDVRSAGTTFIRRGRKTKPQPPAEVQAYDVGSCEKAAWKTIQDIRRDVDAFRATGDPYSFPANPMSLMCSRRFCPAWGTKFCTLHLPHEERNEPAD